MSSRTVFRRTLCLLAAVLAVAGTPAGAVTVDGIAAVVNGEIITLLELEMTGRMLLDESLRSLPAAERGGARREALLPILEQLVMKRLQAQRARQLGIRVSEQEVDTAIRNIMEENRLSDEALERLLGERRVTRAGYRQEIQDQIQLSKLVQQEVRSRVTVTEDEIAAWYAENLDEWVKPERIRIRHLLVPLPEGATPEQVEAARREAVAILERHRAGTDFTDLIREHSAPAPGGDTDPISGEIARGELFPALEEEAFSLPEGGVSDPVQSAAGFHVVQVAERIAAYEPPLDEIRSSIEGKLAESRTRERFELWLKKLREEALIEIRY